MQGPVHSSVLRNELVDGLPFPGAADNELRLRRLDAALSGGDMNAFAPAEAALNLLPQHPAGPEVSSCWLSIARWHFINERLVDAFRSASRSLDVARTLDRPDLRATALKFQAMCLAADGQDAAAMPLMVQALTDARLASHIPQTASILTNIGCILMDAGYYAGACDCFRQSIDTVPIPPAWGCLSQVFLDLGEISLGMDAARRGLALVDPLAVSDRLTQVTLEVTMTQLSIAAGDVTQAAVHAAIAQSVAPTVGQASQRQARLNSLSLAAHEPAKAEDTLAQLMLEIKNIDDVEFDRSDRMILVRALCAMGQPEEALKLLRDLEKRRLSSQASPKRYQLPDGIAAGTSTSLDAQIDAFLKFSQSDALEQSFRRASIPQEDVEHLVRLAVSAEIRESPSADAARVYRVSRLAQLLAREAGADEDQIQVAQLAGLLHDVGKISIPDQLLLKSVSLTDEEIAQVQGHAREGADLIATVKNEGLAEVVRGVRHSHERWDGTGYPAALREDQIPLAARVVAIADSFDSMTHARHYRPARSFAAALDELERGSGTRYDPRLTSLFTSLLRRLYNTTDDLDHILAEGGALFTGGWKFR